MAYKGQLVEFRKKIGVKTKIIRDASSLGENQGCVFLGEIRDNNYQNPENNKGCL